MCDYKRMDQISTGSTGWITALSPTGGAAYLQIVAAIEEAVARGALRPGDRLPSQRELATALGLDMTTVTRAYAEARRRHVLDAVTGRGSFVAAPKRVQGPAVDLSMNIPPAPQGVRLGELIQRGIAEITQRFDVDALMSYHAGPGTLADRSAASAWLEPVLGRLDPERMIVTSGAQTALAACLACLTRPGDTVLAESATYPGFLRLAAQHGVRVVPIAMDLDGLIPDALEAACAATKARIAYVMPSMQNPTTATMPEARRQALAGIAASFDLTVIEDDPYSLLASVRPAALARLAPERTLHIATLSKALTPGLRTAFVAVPDAGWVSRLTPALNALTLMPAPLMTALATHWIRTGRAEDLLRGVRAEAAARQQIARAILPGAASHPEGLHMWLALPDHWPRHRLLDLVQRHGIGLAASDVFHVPGNDPAPDAVRLSLGAVPDRARLKTALADLAALLSQTQEDAALPIV